MVATAPAWGQKPVTAHPLRIVFITQGVSSLVDSLASGPHSLVGLVLAREDRAGLRQPLLCSMIDPVRRFVRGGTALERAARVRNIPCFDYANRGLSPELHDWLKALSPDVVVVYGMGWLLSAPILAIPRLGAINLHPALLPRYRGPRPTQWTYFHMDLEPGVTVHFLDPGEDTGDIIHQRSFRIEPGTAWDTLHRNFIERVGGALLLRTLDDLCRGTVQRRPQPKESPTARARFFPPDRYTELIDWDQWPVERVWHFLRGAPPWVRPISQLPGATGWLEWRVAGYIEGGPGDHPGRVRRNEGGWWLDCLDGRIRLEAAFRPLVLARRWLCSY